MAKDNVVMVTWANLHYLDFVLNWVEHLQRAGVTSFLVGAMDDALLQVPHPPPHAPSLLLSAGQLGYAAVLAAHMCTVLHCLLLGSTQLECSWGYPDEQHAFYALAAA